MTGCRGVAAGSYKALVGREGGSWAFPHQHHRAGGQGCLAQAWVLNCFMPASGRWWGPDSCMVLLMGSMQLAVYRERGTP